MNLRINTSTLLPAAVCVVAVALLLSSYYAERSANPTVTLKAVSLPPLSAEDASSIAQEQARIEARRKCVVDGWALMYNVVYEMKHEYARQISVACGVESTK